MKLLFVTQDFPPTEGGIARTYADLAAGFPEGACVVSTTRSDGPAAPPPPGIAVRRESFPLSRAHRLASRLAWERHVDGHVRREAPGLILCGNLRPLAPICRRQARRHRLPFYVMVHGNDLLSAHRRWSGLRRPTWRGVFGEARRWISPSDAVRNLGVEQLGLPADTAAVIRPEVDADRFHPAGDAGRRSARTRLGLAEADPVILYVGRLIPRKGLDRTLEALGLLASAPGGAPAGWRLLVSGWGDPAPYAALAARLNLSERVTFLGAVADADLPDLYRAADLACMPSRTIADEDDIEGFGIVYLEAAATGLPAVAGRSGGAPEAVIDGKTGLVVDGESAPAIAEAVARLLGDPALRRTLGAAARTRVERTFGPGSRARELLKLIEADFGPQAPAPAAG